MEMKTQGRILFVVAGSLAEFGALVALLADPMGAWHGFLTALAAVMLAVVIYLPFVRPWQVRWGATGEEVARPMPGDDIAGPGARCTTRAVTIQAPAGQVWPLLAQPGYGRAGWYSYDWRDNPGQRSAGQIRPLGQQFSPGDDTRMMPGAGFDLVQVEDGHYFVVRAPDQTMSWCLDLEPLDQHSCRLISRWRARWFNIPASAPWIALSDPSSFTTERRMLLKIKAQAEYAARSGLARRR
jgi:hypothetical protein